MLSPISYNNQPTFGVNLKSRKLALSQKDFFIKIKGYQKNSLWADEIKKTTDEAVELIRKNWDPDWVLFNILEQVLIYASLVLTVISLADYIYKNRTVLTEGTR